MMQQVCLELGALPPLHQSFEGRLLLGLDHQPDAQGVFPVVFQPLERVQATYDAWVSAYRECTQTPRLGSVGQQITNISSPPPHLLKELRAKYQTFVESLQNWLNQTRVNDLSNHGDANSSCFGLGNYVFNPFGESRHLFLQTPTIELWYYPWHEWLGFRRHLDLEVVFMPRFYHPLHSPSRPNSAIRILAILGQERGLNLNADFAALQALPDVELHCLSAPTPEELIALWQEPWDILFYAGHSKEGTIDVNCPLGIHQIRSTLQYAAQRGLQLAIFNSCESIGIAQQLVQLGVPYVIGMRQVIPDCVAQQFLQYFLRNFHGGADLYTAVARARSQLRELFHVEEHLPGAASLPLICRHPQARPLTWEYLKKANRTAPTVLQQETPPPPLPQLLFWCRLQLEQAQQEFSVTERHPFDYPTAPPLQRDLILFLARRRPVELEQYQQSLKNIVHWACGVLRTFGGFEETPQLPFFFAALQLDAEAALTNVPAQRLIPFLQALVNQRQGLHSTHAAMLIMQQQPSEAHLQQALEAFVQALSSKKLDSELKQKFLEQLHQFLAQVSPPLLDLAWSSTEGDTLRQYLDRLANNTQEVNRLRLVAATALGLAGEPFTQRATNIALGILQGSSSLEDVIAASRCLCYLEARLWEVEARLLRFLDWATIHSHRVAVCRTLGLVHPGHPSAIHTLETLIQHQIYDTDTLLSAVEALHRIAPKHPLPVQILKELVAKAQAEKDAVDFYRGLALMKAFDIPISPYLDAAVVRWMREEINVMQARQEPYLEAPHTILWYCTGHLPATEIAKEFQ
ncbi:CHAT domain-containing protein [Thermosynechococcaceae cyanobacterium Okahandja]